MTQTSHLEAVTE